MCQTPEMIFQLCLKRTWLCNCTLPLLESFFTWCFCAWTHPQPFLLLNFLHLLTIMSSLLKLPSFVLISLRWRRWVPLKFLRPFETFQTANLFFWGDQPSWIQQVFIFSLLSVCPIISNIFVFIWCTKRPCPQVPPFLLKRHQHHLYL